MSNHDTRPTFAQLMKRHQIAIEELVVAACQQVHGDRIGEIAYGGRGSAADIDACLAALSRLSGVSYTRANVGGLTCIIDRSEQETTAKEARP